MPAKKITVLVADDDPQLLRLVSRNFQLEGYSVLTANNGQEALNTIHSESPDIALLDVMMPKMDGFTVCEEARKFTAMPIIILTARGQDHDKIRGLDLGADDYLTKPFSVEELMARVRAVLRRSQMTQVEVKQGLNPVITVGEMKIDLAQHQVLLKDQLIALTPIEFRLLTYLAQNAGRVVTQDMLLEHVWGSEYSGESHLLQVNINRLRHKLEPDEENSNYIHTKMGVGYIMPVVPGEEI